MGGFKWCITGPTEGEETLAVNLVRLYQAAAAVPFPGIPKADSQLKHLLE